MADLMIEKKYADCKEIKDADVECNGMLRLYKSSPGEFKLQIRSTGSINEFGNGKPRKMYSCVNVSIEDLEAMLEYAREALK